VFTAINTFEDVLESRINAIEIGKEEQEVPPQNGAGLPAFVT
jgi:hypothetical protein